MYNTCHVLHELHSLHSHSLHQLNSAPPGIRQQNWTSRHPCSHTSAQYAPAAPCNTVLNTSRHAGGCCLLAALRRVHRPCAGKRSLDTQRRSSHAQPTCTSSVLLDTYIAQWLSVYWHRSIPGQIQVPAKCYLTGGSRTCTPHALLYCHCKQVSFDNSCRNVHTAGWKTR